MDISALEKKTTEALKVVEEALSEPAGTFALYEGDAAGGVLLHMLKKAGGGRVPVPVISVQFMPMAGEAFRFIDKLRRIYSLDITYERFRAKPDGSGYTEDERKEKTAAALIRRGVKRVLSSRTEPIGNGPHRREGAYVEYRPLSGFSAEDIEGYIAGHRLPLCSLDLGDAGTADTPDTGVHAEPAEEKELAEKLRKLGYM